MKSATEKLRTPVGCITVPVVGPEASKRDMYYEQRESHGMANPMKNACCAQEGCTTAPVFGPKSSWSRVYCKRHVADDMVYIVRSCAHEGVPPLLRLAPRAARVGCTVSNMQQTEG